MSVVRVCNIENYVSTLQEDTKDRELKTSHLEVRVLSTSTHRSFWNKKGFCWLTVCLDDGHNTPSSLFETDRFKSSSAVA